MPGYPSRPASTRRRLRWLNTLACLSLALSGVWALAFGHVVHGALLGLGAVWLVPMTVWGRRHRFHDPAAAEPLSEVAPRRWRKAA